MPLKNVVFALVMLAVGLCVGFFAKLPPKAQTTSASLTPSPTETKTPQTVLTVEAINPTPATATKTITASGAIVGHELAQVGTKISGVAIEKILVEEGQTVKQGQVLAILDSQNANNGEFEARANLAQAKTNLQKAMSDLARVEPLIKIDAISREQYESYQTAKDNAQAQLDIATARLNNAKLSQTHTQVIAPVSGIISTKTAQIGMMTNGSVLFEIVKNGVLEWQATLDPQSASQLQIGQLARIFVGDKTLTAKVIRISPITNNARQLIVHALIEPSPLVRGGMYQSGEFILNTQNTLALPNKVITYTDGHAYVWTLTAQGQNYLATRTQIQTGQQIGELVAVDLPADTLVVKEGGNFLRDGDLVSLVEKQ